MSESLNRLRGQTPYVQAMDESPIQNNDDSVPSLESLFPDNPLMSVRITSSGVGAGDRIRAALEDHGGIDPTFDYVEREEFEKHVEEDMREHSELREEVRELKGMAENIHEADTILGSVNASGSERPTAVVVAAEAFRDIARSLQVTPPVASLESMDGWVSKLKNFLRVAVSNYSNAARTGVIRPVKSLAAVNANLQRVRRELDKLEHREGIVVTIGGNSANSLTLAGRQVTVDGIIQEVARFVMQVVEVHLVGTENYLMSADAIRRALGEMESLPESDEEFEAILKKAAQMVHSSEVYYEIEPGTAPYLGNVYFKKTEFDPARGYPEWFESIIRMDSAPFFEVTRERRITGTQNIELNTTQLSQLLDLVEESINQLYEADKKWTDKVIEMHTACKDTISKAEKWSSEEMSKFSTMNKRMLDISMKNLLLLPVVLSQPTTVMLNPLIDSLYSVVGLVSTAVKQAK